MFLSMFFNVFYKSEKTCFLCVFLFEINVFNIYGGYDPDIVMG